MVAASMLTRPNIHEIFNSTDEYNFILKKQEKIVGIKVWVVWRVLHFLQ